MKKKIYACFAVLMAISIIFSGCGSESAAAAEKSAETEQTPTVTADQAVSITEESTAAVTEETPSSTVTEQNTDPSQESKNVSGKESVEEQQTEEPEVEPDPAEAVDFELIYNSIRYTAVVTDDEDSTQKWFANGDELVIEAADDKEFSVLYVRWYMRPDPWDIIYEDGTIQHIDTGMYHQTVRLEKPVSKVRIEPSEGSEALLMSELRLFTEGTLPEDIQDWQLLPDGEADIMLFPAHADDEYVFFGGIIPYYAGELGYKVQVCWTINHSVEIFRTHELLNALWKGGCRYYPQICLEIPDYNDELLLAVGFERLEEYEVEMIRRYHPKVVVTHDEAGEYGHNAHIITSLSVEQAVVDAADPEKFPESADEYGVWDVQKTYVHLYGEDPVILDYSIPLDNFGGRTAYEVAVECYREHISQVQTSGYTVYMGDSPYDSRVFGLYRTTVGEDILKNDLLENVSFTTE